MAFGNITALYIPTLANAGSSLWGTDVRKLLDAADAASGGLTITSHGTGGATQRTFDPYTTSSADADQTLFGWAIDPTDMNSVTGALRFYPAGNHVVTARMRHSGATAQTGTLHVFAYRVASAASSRTRTLLGSNTASVSLPTAGGEVTASCTVALGEVIFAADETIQYSFEFNVSGIIATGETVTLFGGTQSSVVSTIATPKLGVLAETTGSAAGTGTSSGVTGKVLGTIGSAAGVGTVSGSGGSRASTTGTATGSATVSGSGGSRAATTGTAAGTSTASGIGGKILGSTGTVTIGADTPDWPATSPTKAIAGNVLHHETDAAVVGATVRLFRDSDNKHLQTDTSGAGGAYSFPRDTSDPYTYHVSADYDDAGTPVHGLTDRGLVPA